LSNWTITCSVYGFATAGKYELGLIEDQESAIHTMCGVFAIGAPANVPEHFSFTRRFPSPQGVKGGGSAERSRFAAVHAPLTACGRIGLRVNGKCPTLSRRLTRGVSRGKVTAAKGAPYFFLFAFISATCLTNLIATSCASPVSILLNWRTSCHSMSLNPSSSCLKR
jgi:hypothetical protein